MVGCPMSIRPSTCPVDRHLPLIAAWALAADIDVIDMHSIAYTGCRRHITGYRSIAAGARAATAGSVLLRAEICGLTRLRIIIVIGTYP